MHNGLQAHRCNSSAAYCGRCPPFLPCRSKSERDAAAEQQQKEQQQRQASVDSGGSIDALSTQQLMQQLGPFLGSGITTVTQRCVLVADATPQQSHDEYGSRPRKRKCECYHQCPCASCLHPRGFVVVEGDANFTPKSR